MKTLEWKLIETAPKDGNDFLGYCNNGKMNEMIIAAYCDNGFKQAIDCTYIWPDLPLTHWMPLPEPPK